MCAADIGDAYELPDHNHWREIKVQPFCKFTERDPWNGVQADG